MIARGVVNIVLHVRLAERSLTRSHDVQLELESLTYTTCTLASPRSYVTNM